MDLNTIALWLATVPAGTLFLKSVRAPQRALGWVFVTALVLLCALCGWLLFPDSVGYLTGALALSFILLPTWIHNAAARASNHFQYGRARRLFRIAALLHPLDGWREMPRLFEAFELAHDGKLEEAVALLRILTQSTSSVAQVAEAHRLRLLGRWRELKALAERNGLATLKRDASLFVLYLRALGELGEVDNLAEYMRAHEQTLIGSGAFDAGILYLFAFSGHIELTRQALVGSRQVYSESAREFWVALAAEHAGDVAQAQRGFKRLRDTGDAQTRERAARHLDNLLLAPAPAPPSPRTQAIVTHFARLAGQRQNLIPNSPRVRTERTLVLALICVNVAAYLGMYFPHWFNPPEALGADWAFYAPDILTGQWWRVLSYLFTHANLIHLVMNMAGLWVLGPFIERAFGRARFAVIYLFSGCVGSAVYLALFWYGIVKPEPLVGASGCIMGLLGATIALMARAWLRDRASIAAQLFFRLLAVVALQVWFDYRTPQIAGLAHMLGLGGGFLAGLVLRERVSTAQSVANLR